MIKLQVTISKIAAFRIFQFAPHSFHCFFSSFLFYYLFFHLRHSLLQIPADWSDHSAISGVNVPVQTEWHSGQTA